jgi:hypothetical protein
MNKTMNKNNDNLFVFLFLILGIIFLPLSVPTTIIINAQPHSDSISGGTTSSSIEREENNTKDPKIKDNIDKQQMGICVVGAGGPCNGDSNFDGRDDRTGQCILSNGCGSSSSSSSNRTVQNKSTNTTSANSTSDSPIMVDGLMLK